jgi:ribosomal protein L7Ae-like RNA K-turn-binding protein
MKVTSDGILSTAIDLKNKKNIHEESSGSHKQKIKSDTVEIRSRLAQRLTTIQNELKTLQSSLTKNQIIKEGIRQLIEDFENGKANTKSIIDQIKFEDKYVLTDFLGNDINYEKITSGNDKVGKLIEKDIADLKGLQVEIENIVASSLADSNIAGTITKIENTLSRVDFSAISNISRLRSDSVLELIK